MTSSSANTSPGTAPRWQRSRVARLVLAVLVVIPLVYAAIYMWMMWDPTSTVDRMPVALVNADQPAGQGADTISAGDDVARELMAANALDFREVNSEQAAQGLADGDYYFIIEIPEDFSSTLAHIGSTTVAPALIGVRYNDYNTIMASNIGARAMSAIYTAILKGVSSTTVGTVLSGVDTLSDGLRSAATGSVQVRDGSSQVSSGAAALADGLTNQLVPGAHSAADGGKQVVSGASALSSGLSQLQGGTDTLGAGAEQLADGIDQLVGAAQVPALEANLQSLRSQVAGTGMNEVTAGLDQIQTLLTGLQQLQAGGREISAQLNDPDAQYRSGLNQLVDGSAQLSVGANQLSTGLDQLSTGADQSSVGAQQLRDGAEQLHGGATQLASGLTEGAAQLPDLGDASQQQSLASLLSTPVATDATFTAQAQFGGPGGAPTLLVIASSLIPLVVLMSFRTHRYLTGGTPPPSTATAIRRFVTVTVVSLVLMAVVAPLLWSTLTPNPDPASLPGVVAMSAAATVMNVALVTLLFTLAGYVGGALTYLAAMMLQFFSYGGVWMVETLPTPLRLLHPIAPMSYVRDGLIAAFNGVHGFAPAMTTIAIITVAAVSVNLIVYRRGQRPADSAAAHEEPVRHGVLV